MNADLTLDSLIQRWCVKDPENTGKTHHFMTHLTSLWRLCSEVGTNVNPLTGWSWDVLGVSRCCDFVLRPSSRVFWQISALRCSRTKTSSWLGGTIVPFGYHTFDACHGAAWHKMQKIRRRSWTWVWNGLNTVFRCFPGCFSWWSWWPTRHCQRLRRRSSDLRFGTQDLEYWSKL